MKTMPPVIISLGLLLLSACGKEPSSQDQRREETNRRVERLQNASGTFQGYSEVSPDNVVPVSLSLDVKRNPVSGEDTPTLQASLRVGLFGGITISSDNVSFDSGNGRLAISFRRNFSASLEFIGTVRNNRIENAVILGPNSGSIPTYLEQNSTNDTITKLANKSEAVLISRNSDDESETGSPTTLLNVTPIIGETRTSELSDLPNLPALDVSLRFDRLSQAPQTSRNVIYDPLRGTMEITFGQNAVLKFKKVFLHKEMLNGVETFGMAPIEGEYVLRSQTIRKITFESLDVGTSMGAKNNSMSASLPPNLFLGTITGNSDLFKYHAIARIDYTGKEGRNTSDKFFTTYPELKLRLGLCIGSRVFSQTEFTLISLDYLNKTATFIRSASNKMGSAGDGASDILELRYSDGWRNLDGNITVTNPEGKNPISPVVELREAKGKSSISCSL